MPAIRARFADCTLPSWGGLTGDLPALARSPLSEWLDGKRWLKTHVSCSDPIRFPPSMKPLALFLSAAAALAMAPVRVGAMDMTMPMTTPMSADQACARFASRLQAAVAAGNIAQAQTMYSEGNQLIASHFNGATCPNVKAP